MTQEQSAHSLYMTVLFCDLARSTELANTLGDEVMFEIVTRYQEICNATISEHGGYVAKFMGDGMLAYFGYPETLKNSAAPAVHAAHDIIRRTQEITVSGEAMSASAGVATGWMVVADANAGAASAETMAIGGTVNLAARLQPEAGQGRIAVSTETSQRLDPDQFALSPLGTRNLRGFAAPTAVWVAQPSVQGRSSSLFVGRAAMLAKLDAVWDRAQAGETACAVLSAPGGFGKTSLGEHFLQRILDENDVFVIRGEIHRRDQSFRAFRPFVEGLAGITGTQDAETRRATLATWAPEEARPGLEVLCALNETPVPPVLRTEMIEAALRTTLSVHLPRTPSVLLVDDAHWLDPDSAKLIGALPEALAEHRLMVLAARRPEGTVLSLPDAETVHLGPMQMDEVDRVIDALDSDGSLNAAARAQIAARADGVPLFVQQITRAVLERSDRALGENIPPTMVEALLERIGNLVDARPMVEAAAILGTEVRIDILAHMLGVDQDQVARQVADLVRRGLFRPAADGTVRFDHALVRDAVLETLLATHVRKLHGAALGGYEAVAPERLASSPVTHATHLMGAGRVAEAIPQLIAAAQAALATGEIAESVRLLRWAEDRLPEVPDDNALREDLELSLHFTLGLSLVQHRGFSDAAVAEAYGRALELCLKGKRSGETEFQIAWGIWAHYMVTGDVGQMTAMSRRMDEIATADTALAVLAASVRSLICCNRGDLEGQEIAHAETRRLYVPELHRLQAVTYSMDSLEMATLFRVHGRYIAGDLEGWRAAFDFSREHEEALALPFLRPYIHVYSTAPYTYAHSDVAYRQDLEAAVEVAGATGQPFWVVAGSVWLAHERVRNGPIDEATDAMEAAVAQMRAIGLSLGRVYHLATLARCFARVGRMAEAEATIAEAEDGIRAGRDLLYGPEVLRIKAEIMNLARQRPSDESAPNDVLGCLETADVEARRMGARTWSALIAGSRARVEAAQIGSEAAQARLDASVTALHQPQDAAHPAFVTARRALELDF